MRSHREVAPVERQEIRLKWEAGVLSKVICLDHDLYPGALRDLCVALRLKPRNMRCGESADYERVYFRADPALHRALQRSAAHEGKPVSIVIRDILAGHYREGDR